MLAQSHLTLQLVRIRNTDAWPKIPGSFCFVFPKGGTGEYFSGSTSNLLSPGDVFLLNENSSGDLRAFEHGEMLFWAFSLSIEHFFPLFAQEEVCLLQSLAEDLKGNRHYPAASPLAAECHRLLMEVPPAFSLDHRAHVLRIAAAVLTREFKQTGAARTGFVRMEDHISQVFERLTADELLTLSAGDLADRFGCSRRHLNRLFHQHFGLSVASLRMEMRLLKAVTLLRNRDAKIIYIAEQCGFNHLGLFNTCFKRRFKVTPGEWRKKSLEGAARNAPAELPRCHLHVTGLCPLSAEQHPAKSAANRRAQAKPKPPPGLRGESREAKPRLTTSKDDTLGMPFRTDTGSTRRLRADI